MAGCKRSSISITCVLVLLFLYIYKTTTNTICATDIAHHSDFNFPLTKKNSKFSSLLCLDIYSQLWKITFGVVSNIYIKKLCACTDPFLFSPFKHKKFYENFPFFSSLCERVQTKTFSFSFLLLKIFFFFFRKWKKSFWKPQKERVASFACRCSE